MLLKTCVCRNITPEKLLYFGAIALYYEKLGEKEHPSSLRHLDKNIW